LHTFGLGESVIGERIRDLMERGRNPEVGTTAGFGIVGIRINATAVSVEAATTLLDGAEAELRQRLGAAIFGRDDETLALVVGELLVRAGRTLSTAESCTGGLLGALLTEVAGSSRYYLGGAITYANELKTGVLGVAPADLARHGAVSAEVAGGMAAGAARAFGSDYALSLTGIAGPGGATTEKPIGLVFIGLRTPETDFTRSTVREFRFGDAPRQAIRLRAAWTALDLLRRALAPDDATTAPAPLRT
ncbi:MAG: nicotinamide-nucleotide amidohydrolase family protein, partial [Planctomycetota bacterium]